MAKQKPVFNHAFDVGEAIAMPWNLPGGRNFLARIVLWGTGVLLLVYAVFGRKFISSYGDFIIQMSEMQADVEAGNPEAIMEMYSGLGAFMGPALLLGLIAWLVFISIETAMHKNVFHGIDHGAFPLRFGKDELRVLLAQLVIFICVMLVYVVGIFAITIIATMAAVAGANSSALGLIVGLHALAGFIAYVVILIRVAQGWAPAAAMSVRDNQQRIFEGWTIVKGRNWPLFGTYLVTFIIGYIAIYLVMIIGGYIAFGNMDFISLMLSTSDDPREMINQMSEAIKQPRVMIPLVIFTIFYALASVLWYIHIWGVGTYMALLDANEKGLVMTP
jgi:hypothetical protein